MNFVSRQALGERFAAEYEQYRNKDAIVICLTDDSMMVALAVARHLYAWVLPPLTAPVYDEHKRLTGLIDTNGIFYNDSTSKLLTKPYADSVTLAKEKIDSSMKPFDPTGRLELVKGRDVLLVADCVWNPVYLSAALQQLEPAKPRSLAAVIGNAGPDVASLARSCSADSVILDVFEDEAKPVDRYFHLQDQLDDTEQHNVAEHIAVYWQR